MTEADRFPTKDRIVARLDALDNPDTRTDKREDSADAPPLGVEEIRIVTLGEFANVDEPGADALLGSDESPVIPEGADVMFYGDGGVGKTTLAIDLGCHLAAGDDWISTKKRPRNAIFRRMRGLFSCGASSTPAVVRGSR